MQKQWDAELMSEQHDRVLVLGAGVAGLTAARALGERGVPVLVLEAQERVGGRVLSRVTAEGDVIELGAEFIHGRPPELWALVDEAGWTTTERSGAMLRLGETEPALHEDQDAEEGNPFQPLEQLADLAEDVSFAQWLAASSVPKGKRAALTGYVEGFNAADAQRISARSLGLQQQAEDATEGDLVWHLHGGYAQLPEYLAKRVRELGGEIRLGSAVTAIRWQPGHVALEAHDPVSGEAVALAGSRCIVTLPLGVLQHAAESGGVRFEPEPAGLKAARRLAMGQVVRFTLVFREPWWQDAPSTRPGTAEPLSFLFTSGEAIPVWWTAHPEPEARATLTGWVGGPRASLLGSRSAAELAREACVALARAFAISETIVHGALVSVHRHDWTADPWARGAYSYVPAGALDAPAAMSQPEDDTLFFAGEHTDTTGHWGTVHAAMRSGLRAAAQVLGE